MDDYDIRAVKGLDDLRVLGMNMATHMTSAEPVELFADSMQKRVLIGLLFSDEGEQKRLLKQTVEEFDWGLVAEWSLAGKVSGIDFKRTLEDCFEVSFEGGCEEDFYQSACLSQWCNPDITPERADDRVAFFNSQVQYLQNVPDIVEQDPDLSKDSRDYALLIRVVGEITMFAISDDSEYHPQKNDRLTDHFQKLRLIENYTLGEFMSAVRRLTTAVKKEYEDRYCLSSDFLKDDLNFAYAYHVDTNFAPNLGLKYEQVIEMLESVAEIGSDKREQALYSMAKAINAERDAPGESFDYD